MSWIEGKQAVITGGSSGIGKEVAIRLAAQGAHVLLACRNRERGEQAATEIEAAASGPSVSVMTVDVSDQRSIRDFAQRCGDRHDAIDVLVNNAGVLLPQRQESGDGVELTFATNVLGYHLMATEMLDLLRAAPSARIVNVASTFAFGLDLEDLQFQRRPYDGMEAYAQSKACNRLLTWALARRLQDTQIAVNAMAPGLVLDTELYRELPSEVRSELAAYGTRTVAEGADTAVWLAASEEVDGVSGKFFEQRAEVACQFRDTDTEERLWDVCDHLAHELEGQP